MKLLRVGQKGKEKPAALDKDGKIRDISSHVEDLNPHHLNLKLFQNYKVRISQHSLKYQAVRGLDHV